MSTKKYERIVTPPIRTTRGGSRYVRPFDILRSDTGRATIKRFAKRAATEQKKHETDQGSKTTAKD